MGCPVAAAAGSLHEQANWATGEDVGILCGITRTGASLRVTGRRGFGEIGLRDMSGGAAPFYLGVLLDNILLAAARPVCWTGACWSAATGRMRCGGGAPVRGGGRSPGLRAPLAGYCSWYQSGSGITARTSSGRPRSLRRGRRTRRKTIQIDDGFQVMPGDWQPNDRFREYWHELPAGSKRRGDPRLVLAPHAVYYRHPVVARIRVAATAADGTPAISFSKLGLVSRPEWSGPPAADVLPDPDHPKPGMDAEIVAAAVVKGGGT